MPTQDLNQPGPLDDHLCYAVYSAGMAIQRLYKPMLDELGLTYPQYLVLNVLWGEDGQTVGSIARSLALESSTVTPLLKRLEAAGLVQRHRSQDDERQVTIVLTEQAMELRAKTGCLADALLSSSDNTATELADLNARIRALRDRIYSKSTEWDAPV